MREFTPHADGVESGLQLRQQAEDAGVRVELEQMAEADARERFDEMEVFNDRVVHAAEADQALMGADAKVFPSVVYVDG